MHPERVLRCTVSKALAISILLCATAGCGPKVKIGYRDPSFTRAALAARGLGVGGMATTVAGGADQTSACAALDTLLWTRLSRDLKVASLRPSSYLRDTMGEDAYDRLRVAQRKAGALSDECRSILAESLPDSVPFLLFGCMDEDRVWTDTAYEPGSKVTTNMTIRQIGVSFEVYDPVLSRTIWKSRLTLRRSTGKQAPEEKALTLGNVVTDILFPSDEEEYEAPPTTSKMLWRLFGGVPEALVER